MIHLVLTENFACTCAYWGGGGGAFRGGGVRNVFQNILRTKRMTPAANEKFVPAKENYV